MKHQTITILPLDKMRVLKQVIILKNDISIGYILYERKLSPDYKFVETPEDEKDFNYYFEYPKQESFPKDNLDDIILQTIRNKYPKSITYNHSIICNVDEDKIKTLKNRATEKGSIQITPDFSKVDLSTLAGQQFEQYYIDVNIYADFRLEDIKNLFFYGNYDMDDDFIINELRKIEFI